MNNKEKEDYKLFSLNEFDIKKITPDSVCVFLGKRGSGKTTLIKDILYHMNNYFKLGIVMSGTDHINGDYNSIIPKKLIFDEYKPEIVNKLMERQKNAILNGDKYLNAFLLLDDVLQDSKIWKKDKTMQNIFYNGRHYKLFLIIASQYAMGLPPDFRSNIDYIFLSRFNQKTDKKKLFDHYAGYFENFYEFEKLYNQVTEDNRCMIIDCKTKSSDFQEQVFYYKAKVRKPFKMCNAYRDHHEEQMDDKTRLKKELFKIKKKNK